MRNCPECNVELSGRSAFCPSCGTELASPGNRQVEGQRPGAGVDTRPSENGSRSRRTLLKYAGGVAAIGVAGVGGFLATSGSGGQLKETAREFTVAYYTDDGKTAGRLLSEETRREIVLQNPALNESQLRRRYARDITDRSALRIDSIEISDRRRYRARVVVDVSVEGERSLADYRSKLLLVLTRRRGVWRVDEISGT